MLVKGACYSDVDYPRSCAATSWTLGITKIWNAGMQLFSTSFDT